MADEQTPDMSIGVFEERQQAERAVEELHRQGYDEQKVGFACPGEEGDPEIVSEPGQTPKPGKHAEAGITGGGLLGGALGAVASGVIPGVGPIVAVGALTGVLGGAAIGGASGGFAAVMKEMGVEEQVAQTCEDELRSGRAIVTVQREEADTKPRSILQQHGAREVKGARG